VWKQGRLFGGIDTFEGCTKPGAMRGDVKREEDVVMQTSSVRTHVD
jgi:hypothetical protein